MELVFKFQKSNDIVCTIGNGRMIMLAGCKEIEGHDDTFPYTAELFINDIEAKCFRKIANLRNDGWGGSTEIDLIHQKYKDDLQELEDYLSKNYIVEYRNKVSFPMTLDYIMNTLAILNIMAGIRGIDILGIERAIKKAPK